MRVNFMISGRIVEWLSGVCIFVLAYMEGWTLGRFRYFLPIVRALSVRFFGAAYLVPLLENGIEIYLKKVQSSSILCTESFKSLFTIKCNSH